MSHYENNAFVGQRIQVDGHEFVHNLFQNCILVYGGGPIMMRDNTLSNVQWHFVDAAARTIYLMSSFYQQGGQGRQFVEFVLSTFGKPIETAPSASSPQETSAVPSSSPAEETTDQSAVDRRLLERS